MLRHVPLCICVHPAEVPLGCAVTCGLATRKHLRYLKRLRNVQTLFIVPRRSELIFLVEE